MHALRGSLARVVLPLLALAACNKGSAGDGDGAGGSAPTGPYAQCVQTINDYRATLGLGPYAAWSDAFGCSDSEAESDSQSGTPHGAFGTCGEHAQNECPGWPGPPEQMIGSCLAMMWAEGPGADFQTHGHYINMSSTSYSKAACGFFTLPNGSVWAVQNFQ